MGSKSIAQTAVHSIRRTSSGLKKRGVDYFNNTQAVCGLAATPFSKSP